MMSSIKSHNTLSELYKIFYSRSTKIVLPIVFIFQPLLSYISSKQILAVGLNATPETNSSLVEPIPPIEYIGFEAILLGLFAMIILGAILGSMEYKNSSLRTSLLLCSNKAVFFVIKFFVTSVFIFVVSFVSIYLSIASAQFGLEREREERNRKNNKEICTKNLIINVSNQEILIEEETISLTKREFTILYTLASNPKRVYSVEELYERIYPSESDAQFRSIAEYIYQIRSKLKPFSINPIKTQWGGGYSWNEN